MHKAQFHFQFTCPHWSALAAGLRFSLYFLLLFFTNHTHWPQAVHWKWLQNDCQTTVRVILKLSSLEIICDSPTLRWRCKYLNYRTISKLACLAKLFDSFVNEQLGAFLSSNASLCPYQSGFRAGHSTVTAATTVASNIAIAVDSKILCAALICQTLLTLLTISYF